MMIFGGFVMFVGVVFFVVDIGMLSICEIFEIVLFGLLIDVVIVMLLVGVISKLVLFLFYFWLLGVMVVLILVSVYLYVVVMVKVGIYFIVCFVLIFVFSVIW